MQKKRFSVFGDMLNQHSRGLQMASNFPQIVSGEVGSSFRTRLRLAVDLNYADHFPGRQKWSAHDFLNRRRSERFGFDAFKHAGVANRIEIVHDFRAAFAYRARGER